MQLLTACVSIPTVSTQTFSDMCRCAKSVKLQIGISCTSTERAQTRDFDNSVFTHYTNALDLLSQRPSIDSRDTADVSCSQQNPS